MPVAVLLLTLGVAAAAIFEARRASISDHDTTRTLVKGHGAVAAWTFGRHAQERLAASFARNLANPGEGGSFFRVPLGTGLPTWEGELDPVARTRIEDAVRAHARSAFRPEWSFAVLQAGGEGGPLVVYTLTETTGGRVARGFLLDPRRYAALFREIFAGESLLPPSLSAGRPNADLVLVQVLAPDERILFASPGELWNAGTTEMLDPEFGGIRVHASILAPAAYDLILGNRAPSRLPLLAGLLVLAVLTAGVAVALLRREADLTRLRSDFVSSVSHELRTPLAQMRLFFETLRLGRYRTGEQREWILDNIERESFRLATLVDNILLFSRTERGGAVGSRSPVEIGPYLGGLVEEFSPLAALRKVQIETTVETGLYAPLDADSFRQVMLNLLDNAIKYGPVGQTVRVSAAPASERVRIVVEDQGPGVHPRERDSIWAPFRRGEDTQESATAGSGIGLSVVREIVEWHEGTAYVETVASGGARFVVEIPRLRQPAASASPARDALQQVG
jgi:signal transduction histidine kinase